ncbi:MAG: N-acetylmuramoyl-L-alanine amidase [Cyanobacteria bacterium P01_F01_bin.150]
MRIYKLLPGVLGFVGSLLLASAADAAQLQLWRFNAENNRLTFTTDEDVRPRAQLVANPTRIVIDLPGISFNQATATQAVGGAIREVRVGQFDAQTTRLVIELNAGYTIDPQQVRVQGSTPTQWLVQLPTPQRTDSTGSPAPSPSPGATPEPSPLVPGAATRIDGMRITPDGLFLETEGAAPDIDVRRAGRRRRKRRRLLVELSNTTLTDQFPEREMDLDQFGIEEIEFEQLEDDDDRPLVRITLEREDEDQNWQVTASNLGGIVMIPTGGVRLPPRNDSNRDRDSQVSDGPLTIQGVSLANNGTQLLIQGSGAIANHTAGWDRVTTDYQIVIPNARLDSNVSQPELASGGPLLRFRMYEQSDNVVISFLPASGIQLGAISKPTTQSLALNLSGSGTPFPGLPPLPGTTPDGPISLPDLADRRVVLVIDPGHGGRDPGAVGINDLYEKHVVLPVSLEVTELLREQGVNVVMTRSTDRELDLESRVQIAERANADLFVSIHANAISLSRPDVNGIETYYYSDAGLEIAQYVHESLLEATGGPDRGVRRARFYVIRRTSMPAVLLEVGFVTGADDAPLLETDAYRSLIAQAIARGILQYLIEQ